MNWARDLRRWRGVAGTANLIDDREITAQLIANPLDWRVRVVEELTIETATTCLRRRSLQVAPLREHLGTEFAKGTSHALVGLFVAPVPRGPLLDFNVTGPGGCDGWLLPRLEIAERQTLYLVNLAESCGHQASAGVYTILSAVCGFTGELLTDMRGSYLPLQYYLEDGLGRKVPESTVQQWRDIGRSCKEVLRPHLQTFRGYSAPENPALVLPELFANGLLETDGEATEWMTDYANFLSALQGTENESGPTVATEFLQALADYANYYDLIVAMRVPLDEPFLVKFSERRDLSLSLFRNRGRQELVVADARTNHVTFKIPDPNVRIREFSAIQPGSDAYSYGVFQSREDAQSRAFYAHDPDRDYRIQLAFRLALLRRLQFVPYFVALFLGALTVALLIEAPTDLRTLALIVGPAALAASVLLAREPSTLGSRLRLASSVVLAASLLLLLGAAACLFAGGQIHQGEEHRVSTPQQSKHQGPSTPRPSDGRVSSPASTITPKEGHHG